MEQEKNNDTKISITELENNKAEFMKSYKDSCFDNHILKLFDKTGKEIIEHDEDGKWLEDLLLRLKCFFQEILKLDTISFLFGTGSSIPLGSVSIYKIPEEITNEIQDKGLKDIHEQLFSISGDISLEEYLGNLIKFRTVANKFNSIIKFDKNIKPGSIDNLIEIIKESLFTLCNVPNLEKIKGELYKNEPLFVHKEFIKKVLARPINLKRINIFTTNYDLAFEKTLDELGVLYIDGFVGNVTRMFKPEAYNYDYYFPATTTEGKVHRLDKVIHLYKLHGSLNWVECEPNSRNIFGIEQRSGKVEYNQSLLIYPQPMKEEETLGFPYSEMIRRYASIIQQPQNVLISYGYGFGDEYINRIIYNALSISTFQLIVISFGWTEKIKEFYEKVKEDSRISFLIGSYLGDWYNFVMNILPDIKQLESEEKILKTMRKLKGEDKEEE